MLMARRQKADSTRTVAARDVPRIAAGSRKIAEKMQEREQEIQAQEREMRLQVQVLSLRNQRKKNQRKPSGIFTKERLNKREINEAKP